MAKLLFLDCDGTIRQPASWSWFIDHPQDQRIIPGADKAGRKYSFWMCPARAAPDLPQIFDRHPFGDARFPISLLDGNRAFSNRRVGDVLLNGVASKATN